ncbi:hypothetical protein P692DRAFT_201801435 [Suillus brevipes Sb2]|nr:hypothetical protein P692DRAFT_201801435 [Suillus brevipes Sb2]
MSLTNCACVRVSSPGVSGDVLASKIRKLCQGNVQPEERNCSHMDLWHLSHSRTPRLIRPDKSRLEVPDKLDVGLGVDALKVSTEDKYIACICSNVQRSGGSK